MKILLLTPIDPINSAYYYHKLLDHFDKKEVGIVSFPFFAETYARLEDKMYLPSFFAMLKSVDDPKTRHTVFNRSNILVVGNMYNTEKFDMIISLGSEEENTYVNAIKIDPEFAEFKLLAEPEKLFQWKDAQLNLPTIEHVNLFLEGVYKNDSVQRRTT